MPRARKSRLYRSVLIFLAFAGTSHYQRGCIMARGLHLLGLVALGAATTIAIERPSPAAEPIPIKFVMDWAWEGTQASWAIASDSGCYAKAGLDVKTDRGFGSGDAI